MGKITFILGGARSGKSGLAIKLAKASGKRVAFIATGQPGDGEMKRRIAIHKKSRPLHWKTFENYKDLPALLGKIGSRFDCLIIDCLTLYISNLLLKGLNERQIENYVKKALNTLKKPGQNSIIVSNEVGLGIVPENNMARGFRDIAGRVNQSVAAQSSDIFYMVAGIPLKLK